MNAICELYGYVRVWITWPATALVSCLATLLALLAVTSPALAESEIADAAYPLRAESIVTGKGSFEFANWDGPNLRVWTYVPPAIDRLTAPIVIVMHGARRNADDYRDQWVDAAERGGFIVVAPGFSREDFPGANGYNLGAVFERERGEMRDRRLWAFSAIEPIFDIAVARLGGSQMSYTIYGHSAGSQFVHRFLFFKPGARAKRYLAANAGWYTFADPAIDYPFGLGGLPVSEDELRNALAKDLVILLGDQDNDPSGALLNQSDGAKRQGPHRFARGRSFYAAAQTYAESRGWDFGWRLEVVEGVAHSNSGMAGTAGTFVE